MKPKNKDEFRQELAAVFSNILQEKGLDWKKEWQGRGGSSPHNGITKANYWGCNAFYLSLVAMAKGYDDPRWVTMVQIMDKDGKYHPKQKWHLKAGSKGTHVEYWYPYDPKEKKALTWPQYKDAIRDGRKPEEFILSTRYTPVFNACDVEGMPDYVKEDVTIQADDLIGTLSKNMEVPIYYDGGDDAYYSPTFDCVHLPRPEHFHSPYAFNATALHELSHATGHGSRLGRDQGMFGTEAYAYEELVAEMCSCFMGVHLQTEPEPRHMDNHKAYVQAWISAIREKPDTLVRAIKDAQTAATFMDWKAGLISDKEYADSKERLITVPSNLEKSPAQKIMVR